MADNKKYNGSTWEHSLRKLTTATDTFTTLPADIYADGNNATVGISGNMEQLGTPTPDNPIMPQGTGERTGNLLDYTTVESTSYATATPISGGITISGQYYVQFNTVKFTVGRSYTMSWTAKTISGMVKIMWRFRYSDNTYSPMPSSGESLVAEKEVVALFLYVNGSSTKSGVAEITNIMLNSGSTALPYEPYGYKIPISSANTTTPVYLGEVETTRRIKKLVFTGDENWYIEGSNIFYTDIMNNVYRKFALICSHFKGVLSLQNNNDITISLSLRINIKTDYVTHNVNDFKTYLAQQYSAGTPVTVWYVLATEQTGIVNEPLMKIGDYADTLSNAAQIPTTEGANSITVDTTVQPSEFSAKWTGWHNSSVKEWDGSDWS